MSSKELQFNQTSMSVPQGYTMYCVEFSPSPKAARVLPENFDLVNDFEDFSDNITQDFYIVVALDRVLAELIALDLHVNNEPKNQKKIFYSPAANVNSNLRVHPPGLPPPTV